MSGPQDARGPKAVARFLRPRSVAIIGISTREGSAGQIILQCLKVNNFKGDIYLVGRTDEPIDGRPVLKSPDELPEGVELAVFTLPAAAVHEAIVSCARRKVRSAMVFAAGFAEVGDHATQDAVTSYRAGRRARRCRAELPRRHQQRRWHDVAHAVMRARRCAASRMALLSSAKAAACLGIFSALPTAAAFPSPT